MRSSKMKRFFIVLVVGFFGVTTIRSTVSRSSRDIGIQFQEPLVNLGECYEGELAETELVFTNRGHLPLQISSVTGSCSCMVTEFSERTIAPGMRGKIKVAINTEGKQGAFKGSYAVAYSDSKRERISKVEISLHILTAGKLAALPNSIYIGSTQAGKQIDATIRLQQIGNASVVTRILDLHSPSWLHLDLVDTSVATQHLLKVRGLVPETSGELFQKIVLTTDDPNFSTIEIPIVGFVEGNIVCEPRSVFQLCKSGQHFEPIHVKLYSKTGRKTRIVRIDFEDLGNEKVRATIKQPQKTAQAIVAVAPLLCEPIEDTVVIKGRMLISVEHGTKNEIVRVPLLYVRNQVVRDSLKKR